MGTNHNLPLKGSSQLAGANTDAKNAIISRETK